MTKGKHISVLLKETIAGLNPREGGRYVDGTLGRAGHTYEILKAGGNVLGIDRDDQALCEVKAKAEGEEWSRLTIAKGNHGDLAEIAAEHGWSEVDGVLLDLGVSSPQLDEAERGFSFMREGPLDMRMNQAEGESAADIVNGESEEELTRIFRELGEEPGAKRLAKAIVKARGEGKIFATTTELASFIEKTLGRHGAHHPATRAFQALRMEVNDEMGELERALEGAMKLLKVGGRLAVITFESLSDTLVKRHFAAHIGKMRSLQQGGEVWEGKLPRFKAVNRKAIQASEEEIAMNPRSRSAKLRVVEKEG